MINPADATESIDAKAPEPSKIDLLIEDWFRRHMTNSIVSQQAPIYNRVRAAVDELKSDLAKATGDGKA